jgi:hypothetical protein
MVGSLRAVRPIYMWTGWWVPRPLPWVKDLRVRNMDIMSRLGSPLTMVRAIGLKGDPARWCSSAKNKLTLVTALCRMQIGAAALLSLCVFHVAQASQ